jgi:glycosyltransferase involved in cell wall biosynthesis
MRALFKILTARERKGRTQAYLMAVDGGAGVLYNALLVAAIRVRAAPLALYHHSARNIVRSSSLMSLLLRIAGSGAVHVACSEKMIAQLAQRYGNARRSMVISNVAWIQQRLSVLSREAGSVTTPQTITLGFMSLLSKEKGLLHAVETFRQGIRHGLPMRLLLAGKLSPGAERTIARGREEFGDRIAYSGELDEDKKWDFLASIDYLVFPSLYEHETQSLVAGEAMAAGVPVIAFDHRYVGELVKPSGGIAIDISEDFATSAIRWILAAPRASDIAVRRAQAQGHFQTIHASSEGQIERLIAWLLNPAV